MAKEIKQHLQFDSIADMRALATLSWQIEGNHTRALHYVTDSDSDTKRHGIAGGAVAIMAALVKGYPAGEAKILAMRQQIAGKLPVAVGLGRRIVRGPMGDHLDIHTVNRGCVDKAWESRQRKIKRGHSSIRIVCDLGGNWNMSAESLQWRGIAAACLAEVMTAARYRTELVGAFCVANYAGGHTNGLVSCVVKPFNVAADYGLLAASLCLTGFFRTIGFAAICRLADNEGKHVDGGLGHSVSVEGIYPAAFDIAQVIVPHSVTSAESAAKWITDTVTMLQGMTKAA